MSVLKTWVLYHFFYFCKIFLLLRKYFIESFLVFSPVFMDLHAEGEEYFLIENPLEDETRSRSDFLDLGSSFSDHDDFLTLGFDIDIGLH